MLAWMTCRAAKQDVAAWVKEQHDLLDMMGGPSLNTCLHLYSLQCCVGEM